MASIIAALILLVGAALLLVLSSVVLLYAGAGVATIFNIVAAFAQSMVEGTVVALIVSAIAAGIYRIPSSSLTRWQRVAKTHSAFRHALQPRVAFIRAQPYRLRLAVFFLIAVAPLAVILTIAHLWVGGAVEWNAVRALSSELSSAHAPIGRVGRTTATEPLRTVQDIDAYERTRVARAMEYDSRMRSAIDHARSVKTRCGTVLVPRRGEIHKLANLVTDVGESPPVRKHEYIFNEEELTGFFLAASPADGEVSLLIDCVKLHQGYVEVYATTHRPDNSKIAWVYKLSISKIERGRLQMRLEEVSRNWVSVQLGWLDGGSVGGGWLGFLGRQTDWGREMADLVSTVDSRIYSVEIHEGYLRIVTWRLPTVIAARSAHDVGYVSKAANFRTSPNMASGSLGPSVVDEVVYVLLESAEWMYVSSEVTGRFGWLPPGAVKRLDD